jgi:ribosomal protein S18 acetylase RimI-like enzyme
MQIRPFRPEDEDPVVALWQACGLTRPWNDPRKDIARKLAVQRELFLVGEREGRVIATVMAGYDGHRAWIYYLAVAPGHQGAGLGTQLVRRVEQEMLARGCPKVSLLVRSSNAQVLAFYRKLGYAQDDAVPLGKRLIPDLPETSQPRSGPQ